VRIDARLSNSYLGLAKIEQHKQEYAAALKDLDRVISLDSGNAAARYLRGQVLVHMGREKEGREELATATKMLNEQRAARHRELEGETVPSPEVAQEPH